MASEQDPKEGNKQVDKENEKDNEGEEKENKKNDKEKDEESNTQPDSGGAGDVVTDFIEDVWKVMTPEMVERLRCVLTEDMGLSKKDANQLIQSQREIRKQRICLQKDKKPVRIGIRNQWIKELSRDVASPIASFLVSVLLSNRTPRSKQLTEKILERLCQLTGEKTTVKTAKTRVQRTLVVIADRMATYFDEALCEIEKEMSRVGGFIPVCEEWEAESVATISSTETYTPSEGDDYDLDKLSESELERILAKEEKKPKVSIQENPDFISDEEGKSYKEGESDKEESETKDGSEEVETVEDEDEGTEVSAEETEEGVDDDFEEEEEKEDLSEIEEEAEEEEEDEEKGNVEEEEDVGEEEEENEEEEEADEEENGEGEEDDEGIEELEEIEEEKKSEGAKGEDEVKPSRKLLDIMELMKEDIERTPKGDGKTERQMAVKDIIEKRFEEIAKDKLDKSLDSIVRFDIDETASIVANWLEKILPSGDIVAKPSLVPSIIEKQGSAFEVIGEGSQYEVHRLSSTTVAKRVADTKGVDFPVRKKKLPRSMSPLNAQTTKDWADWALEAANVGEEWGKWLDKALEDVEERLVKGKDKENSPVEKREEWKNWKDAMEHEAQKWRAEKHKIKGEAYLWNKKIASKKPEGPEKETKVVTY